MERSWPRTEMANLGQSEKFAIEHRDGDAVEKIFSKRIAKTKTNVMFHLDGLKNITV